MHRINCRRRALNTTFLGGGLLAIGSAFAAMEPPTSPNGEEWTSLFNGKDLDGWVYKEKGSELGVDPSGTVKVEDGVIRMDYSGWDRFNGRFGHLHHEVPHDHYRIRVVYRFTGNQCTGGPGWAFRNSGIMVHGQDPKSIRKDQDFFAGSLPGLSPDGSGLISIDLNSTG